LRETTADAIRCSIIQREGVFCPGVDTVKNVDINAGREESSLPKNLEGGSGNKQGIEDHNEEQQGKDNKTGDEL
jgi:hypothetical protein